MLGMQSSDIYSERIDIACGRVPLPGRLLFDVPRGHGHVSCVCRTLANSPIPGYRIGLSAIVIMR